MSLRLFAHPFSSYCQKVLMALYENATPFEMLILEQAHPEHFAELLTHWPFGKFPVLTDNGRPMAESSTIIEYLEVHHPGPVRLIPSDPDVAIEARLLDRVFDQYVMNGQFPFIRDKLLPPERRDPENLVEARKMLDTAYAWLDQRLAGREWATGGAFSLADCAAAPALFYADWAYPIADRFTTLKAYRARLLARPSYARCVDEARPYRHLYPLGAPDRD
jgi:glutathione S-transferase